MNDGCHNSSQPGASANAGVNAWVDAGFPPNKIVLGVPSYGYVSRSNATGLRTRDVPLAPNPADKGVQVTSDDGSAETGQVQFRSLVAQGCLCEPPDAPGAFQGCGGCTRHWDSCSSTPFLLTSVGQVVAYDDTQSLELKASYARQRGLLGVNMFDVHGDTDQFVLVDALRKGLGL